MDVPIGIDGCALCGRAADEEHADNCKVLKMEGREVIMWDMIERNMDLKAEIFDLRERQKEILKYVELAKTNIHEYLDAKTTKNVEYLNAALRNLQL